MKRIVTALTLSALAVSGGLAAAGKLKMQDLPPAVQQAVKDQTRNATIVGLSKEKDKGKTVYEVETKVNGRTRDFMVDATGKVYGVEEEVAIDSIPAAARAAIEKQAAGGKVSRVETLTNDGRAVYEAAIVKKDGKKAEVSVNADGSAVK